MSASSDQVPILEDIHSDGRSSGLSPLLRPSRHVTVTIRTWSAVARLTAAGQRLTYTAFPFNHRLRIRSGEPSRGIFSYLSAKVQKKSYICKFFLIFLQKVFILISLFDIQHKTFQVLALRMIDVYRVILWLMQLVQDAYFAPCLCSGAEHRQAERLLVNSL